MVKLLKKYKSDFFLIGSILIIALIVLAILAFTAKSGKMVKVIIDGKEKYAYNLNENKEEIIFTGKNNEFQNIVVIENGEVFIKNANCPDKICVSHRKISKKGQTIVCLPHKLVVEVE
jgi:hypothetical protein